MKKTSIAALLILALAACAVAYRIDGPQLMTDTGAPVRLTAVGITPVNDAGAVFEALKKQGIKLAAISAAACGISQDAIQTEPGKYSEEALKKLDAQVAAAGKNGIGLMIALSDPLAKDAYMNWAGGSNPDIFYKDKPSREIFKRFISMLLSRTNTVNGLKYSSDPAIFAWDLCALAENRYDPTGMSLYKWVEEMSAYVKAADPKHAVMISLKEALATGEAAGGADIYSLPGIDLAYYPVPEPQESGIAEQTKKISASTKMLSGASGKPVILALGGKRGAFDLVKAHIEAGGAIAILPAGLEDEQARKASDFASSVTDKTPSVAVKTASVSVSPYSAGVSFELSRAADVRVVYGTSMPLKQSAVYKGAAAKGEVKLDGLKPGTAYMCLVKAQDMATGASGISKLVRFTTPLPKRDTALKFTRSKNFITAKNGDFYDGDRVYRYVGANCYYLRYYAPERRDKMPMSQAEQTEARHRNMDYVLSEAAKIGLKVMRIGSNGEAVDEQEAKTADPLRYIRIGPDKFNEKALVEFDYVMEAARRNNMRVIIHFTDNWEYYGGVAVYAKWAGVGREEFWTNEQCKKYYKQTIDKWVDRVNTVSGIKYKDDPVVFCWELCNEPWDRNDTTGRELARWIDEMAAYIKSKDGKHMVSTGTDSFFLKEDGTHYSGSDFVQDHQSKYVDFCTYHVYPTYEHNRFSLNTTKFLIDKWVDAGKALGKPVVMEEFGITNNGEYNRQLWIDEMLKEFYARGGKGANYWFFRDASYTYGDGFDFSPAETETVNVFIKYANMLNKGGY